MGGGTSIEAGAVHVLSWSVVLPPRTSLLVGLDFVKPLRHVDMMPADASRGLDIGSATLAYDEHLGRTGWPQQTLFTEAAVVTVPIADASMPFNVIAISSTLIALFVGSMFNTLVRRPEPLLEQQSDGND
jgi:phosphatidylinositol glycan class T